MLEFCAGAREFCAPPLEFCAGTLKFCAAPLEFCAGTCEFCAFVLDFSDLAMIRLGDFDYQRWYMYQPHDYTEN